MIVGLHHVTVLVADTDRALEFYCGVLGLEQDRHRPDLGFPGAWLNAGDGRQIHLMELPNPDPLSGRPEHGGRDRHFALLVDDSRPIVDRLRQVGIAFTQSRSGRSALFLRDPDGNVVELIGG